MRIGDDNLKTKLDDNASIYAKADTRTEKQKWKDLKGLAKWQFFKDYILERVLWIIVIAGLVIGLCYSIFRAKPDEILYTIVMDNPFTDEAVETIRTDLTERLVTDPDKEKIFFDTDYNMTYDEYNSQMKFSTLLAAAQIDCVIMPITELQTDVNSGLAINLEEELSSELYEAAAKARLLVEVTPKPTDNAMSEKIQSVQGIPASYAIDVTPMITALSGYEPSRRYVMIVLANAPCKDNGIDFIEYVVHSYKRTD